MRQSQSRSDFQLWLSYDFKKRLGELHSCISRLYGHFNQRMLVVGDGLAVWTCRVFAPLQMRV